MESLAAAICEYLPGQPVTVLTGVLADKDFGQMYDALAPLAARFITVTPPNPRALDAGELAAFLRRYGKPVTACDTIREGVSRMLADTLPDGAAVCCHAEHDRCHGRLPAGRAGRAAGCQGGV